MSAVLTIHIFCTFFMTGLVWFVQIVHYPLFKNVPLEEFPAYEKKNFVTAFVTVPTMIIELLTGLWLLYLSFDVFNVSNVVLLGFIGLSTMIFQVPIHLQLTKKATIPLMDKLIRTNWIRTICWTLRSGILLYLMLGSV